ncbi:MAG TPA: ABC transporter ATP-binding protein [Burkholderiales bacterium]|jgi:ABC-2 type transport system ATP-binding protein|nr:ABC transporter ATP-binding protein [Burkholderiales bacterium]
MTMHETGGTPAISFRGLSKTYADTAVLHRLALDIPAGRTFGLVGMNGAGKTTLIKCLLDFCEFDAGDILIFGLRSRDTHARARLAFLPERFVPPYYLTGEDFLRYMMRLYSCGYDQVQVGHMLADLDLSASALRKPVHTFSKGMTQKLGLAACLLSNRELLVLDEPTSGLDPKARALLKKRLQAARADGRTVFFTSHVLADVEELCERMAVLHQGELRFCGTPAELRNHFSAATLEQAYLACIQ